MKRSRTSWCVAIGVTGAVHASLFWAATSSWSGPVQPWADPPAVTLVSIEGGAVPLDEGRAKPASEPEQARPADEIRTATATPEPLKPVPISTAPTPLTAAPATPAPADAEAAPPRSAPAPAPAPAPPATRPNPPAPPQRAGEATGLDVNAPRGKSQDYAAMLRTWLEAHKTYPRHAKMRREEGVVQIRFAVDRQGRLLEGAVVRSSGVSSLDREALAMLDRSNPFPAAPHSVRGERIELLTPVEFYLR